MFTDLFQELGLSKNEAKLYEVLLQEGECAVGELAVKSKVHRRNVYDAIKRLIDKGLAFEILERTENRYQAVEPGKLLELIREKEAKVTRALPSLEKLFTSIPQENAVHMYRGVEGWKNYMRDIIRTGEDFYCIGGKGAWMDSENQNFFPQFIKDAKKKKITFYHLFEWEVKNSKHDIVQYVGDNYRFLPKEYQTPASIDIFGNRVNLVSNIHIGGIDKNISFAVIINQQVADAFRIWFRMMWDFCPKA